MKLTTLDPLDIADDIADEAAVNGRWRLSSHTSNGRTAWDIIAIDDETDWVLLNCGNEEVARQTFDRIVDQQ